MIIALVGPHAVGKSTAARAWSKRYPNINFVDTDQSTWYKGDGHTERVVGWQLKAEQKVALATQCATSNELWVIEGNSSRVSSWLRIVPCVAIIHAYCSPDLLFNNIQQRCKENGRHFNEDYWDEQKLRYESVQRIRNLHRKQISKIPLYEFEIINRKTDWKFVTHTFIKLLHGVKD